MTEGSSRTAWHALEGQQVLSLLKGGDEGLTQADADARLRHLGPNVFERTPPASVWKILIQQFRSVVVGLLVAAVLVAVLTGDVPDALAIAAVLLLNVSIGFTTELRAHRAMEALLAMEVTRARVLRDGSAREIDARELVPGDVILVEAGQSIPADARLLEGSELRTTEASLTGESLPVEKDPQCLESDAPLPERANLLYKTTVVVAGRGRAVVTATGMATEVGKIGRLTAAVVETQTPLERRLDTLGHRLAGVALVVAVLVAALGLLQGASLAELLQAAIALAVAAVPEGLPVVGTIAMAVGVRRMARRRALVRHLPVVETLGSATVICTDKTGTLTAGSMSLSVIQVYDGAITVPETTFTPSPDVALALRIAVLANRAELVESEGEWKPQGDPTEAAVLVAARKAGLDYRALRQDWAEIGELPFSSERMYMATFHRTPQGRVACVKGAPGRLVRWSTRALTPEGPRELDDAGRNRLLELNKELAGRGLRVLAVAMAQTEGASEADLRGLTWVGYLGLSDPPAPGVEATIRSFQEAGIRTVMLTGDQQLTAESVARELGLLAAGLTALDGRELDRLSDDNLADAVGRTVVYSRVSPEAKLRIVSAYQARGDVVAMLGDGVNDAAALRKADIGVAMGIRGTDLAKEAADVILADDRFATIAVAVEQGRIIFDNIRKFVFYLFSCNLAEILVMLGAGLVGFPVPLLPLQILWLNLVTDTFPALVLAVEPGEPGVMRQPPRDPQAAILDSALMRATLAYGILIAACALGAFAWGLSGSTGGLVRASTLAFLTLAFAQIFHLGNARSAGPVLSPRLAFSNPLAVAAVILAVGLQVLAVAYPPLAHLLKVRPPDLWDWIVVITLGLVSAVAGQTAKAARAVRKEPPSRRAPGSSGR